jgi:guanylate kinase
MNHDAMSRMLLDQGIMNHLHTQLIYYFGNGPIVGIFITMLSVTILGYIRKIDIKTYFSIIAGKLATRKYKTTVKHVIMHNKDGLIIGNTNCKKQNNKDIYNAIQCYLSIHNSKNTNTDVSHSISSGLSLGGRDYMKVRTIEFNPQNNAIVDTFPDLRIYHTDINIINDKNFTLGGEFTISTHVSLDYVHEFLTACIDVYIDKTYPISSVQRLRRIFAPCRLNNELKFDMFYLRDSKYFETVFSPKVDIIRAHLKQLQNGVVDKMILLLTGPPGTGKSSMIKAITTEDDRDIIEVNLNNIHTMRELRSLIHARQYADSVTGTDYAISSKTKCFIFEDITDDTDIIKKPEYQDTVYDSDNDSDDSDHDNDKKDKKKKKKKSKSTLTLQNVLQVFDGVIGLTGMIFILTTNNPEQLHTAFTRKGRITLEVKMDNMEREYLEKYTGYYFDIDGSKKEKPGTNCNDPIEIAGYTDYALSPASVENIFIHANCLDEFINEILLASG